MVMLEDKLCLRFHSERHCFSQLVQLEQQSVDFLRGPGHIVYLRSCKSGPFANWQCQFRSKIVSPTDHGTYVKADSFVDLVA